MTSQPVWRFLIDKSRFRSENPDFGLKMPNVSSKCLEMPNLSSGRDVESELEMPNLSSRCRTRVDS